MYYCLVFLFFFFFNATATTEIYTLSLHDALPIFPRNRNSSGRELVCVMLPLRTAFALFEERACGLELDRKSTRLNSSHSSISYAVFCLKKKKSTNKIHVSI